MADGLLESSALSAFCGSVSTMLGAGIQTDEAVHMLAENRSDSRFKQVCSHVYTQLIRGNSLAESMESSGAFPRYAIDMVTAGERSGRLEPALHNLDHYYDEENRLFAKLRTSVSYPAMLLCIMAVILAFTVAFILPVFINVYENMTGSLTSSRNEAGREKLMGILEKLPFTRKAMYQIALSRFTATIATYVSSGITAERAMTEALKTVTHTDLRDKLQTAYNAMIDPQNPRSLVQAFTESDIYEPVYARMLAVGNRAGSLDNVLEHLSDVYFDDAITQVDLLIAKVEPVLAGFLTITVGGTLVAVMLPLVGIMRSIG